MARTKTYLQNTMTLEELDEFAAHVATNYANSEHRFSCSYYMEEENITRECFYWLLEWAIVRNKVPDKIVAKMRAKSDANANRKSREYANQGNMRSQLRYSRMIGQRKWFIFLEGIPKEKKIEITTYFAEHPELSKEECANKFGIPKAKMIAIDKIIEDTLLQNYVDDKIYQKVRKRSLGSNPTEAGVSYFNKLKRRRNKNKKTAR